MKTIFFKRGETLKFTVRIVDDEGNPLDIDTADMKSEIRDSYNKFVAKFDITESSESGIYTLICEDTLNFPLTDVYFDIAIITNDNNMIYSPTYTITVQKEITRL